MKRMLCSLILLAAILNTNSIEAKDKMVFSKPLATNPSIIIPERILKHAYKKLGIIIQFDKSPGKRGLILSNEGQRDGEIFRIRGINKKYRNLIMVSVPAEIRHFGLLLLISNNRDPIPAAIIIAFIPFFLLPLDCF